MLDKGSLRSQAEQLSEEGRLLLILGKTLGKLASSPREESLGPWALNALQELKSNKAAITRNAGRPLPRKTRSVRKGSRVSPGRPVVIWIASGSHRGKWTTLAAGVDEAGHKQILAVRDGSSLNPVVCEALVNELTTQGIPGDGDVLVVTDGSQCLEDTMRLHWDQIPVLAHCRSTVRKAVVAHLQGDERRSLCERLRNAWRLGEAAEDELKALVEELDRDHPGAAERLERSLEATLVVDRLGVNEPLRDHLVVAGVPRMALLRAREWDVKNEGNLASGLATWLEKSRRLQGYRALPELAENLRQLANNKSVRKEEAASKSLPSTTQPTK